MIGLSLDLENLEQGGNRQRIGLSRGGDGLHHEVIEVDDISDGIFIGVLVVVFDNGPIGDLDELEVFAGEFVLLTLH